MKEVLLNISKLEFKAGNRQLLHDISIEIMAGDFVCIIGPNGSGKTTLIRCICRILNSWTGDIEVNGKNIRKFSQTGLAKELSYVPQAQGAELPFTVYEYVSMGRYPYQSACSRISRSDRDIIYHSMQVVGVDRLSDRRMTTLSGGERQRVYIAAALAQDTRILFLDEPSTYLDIRHQAELLALLKMLHAEKGYTIVCVTHDINSAVTLGSRILGLKNGRVQFLRNTDDIQDADILKDLFDVEFQFIERRSDAVPIFVPGRDC